MIDDKRLAYIGDLYSESSNPMVHELITEVRRLREFDKLIMGVAHKVADEHKARIRELEEHNKTLSDKCEHFTEGSLRGLLAGANDRIRELEGEVKNKGWALGTTKEHIAVQKARIGKLEAALDTIMNGENAWAHEIARAALQD